MSASTRWTITIPNELADAVNLLAEESGIKRSQIINMLLGRGLSVEYLLEGGGTILYRATDGKEHVLLNKVDRMSLKKLRDSGLIRQAS